MKIRSHSKIPRKMSSQTHRRPSVGIHFVPDAALYCAARRACSRVRTQVKAVPTVSIRLGLKFEQSGRNAPHSTPQTLSGRRQFAVAPAGEPGHRDWELAIHGDLTDKQSDLVARMLEVPRRSRGIIFFDSCGGSAYVGLALASLIRLRGLKADAVVAGECSSAALMPFAACQPAIRDEAFDPACSTRSAGKARRTCGWRRPPNGPATSSSSKAELDELLAKMFGCSLEMLTQMDAAGPLRQRARAGRRGTCAARSTCLPATSGSRSASSPDSACLDNRYCRS